jgi:hypothetical protein
VRAFVTAEAGKAGVIALFASRAFAEAFAAEDSRAGLSSALGASGSSVTLFEAPLLIDATLR